MTKYALHLHFGMWRGKRRTLSQFNQTSRVAQVYLVYSGLLYYFSAEVTTCNAYLVYGSFFFLSSWGTLTQIWYINEKNNLDCFCSIYDFYLCLILSLPCFVCPCFLFLYVSFCLQSMEYDRSAKRNALCLQKVAYAIGINQYVLGL